MKIKRISSLKTLINKYSMKKVKIIIIYYFIQIILGNLFPFKVPLLTHVHYLKQD